jgi:hypothetical protein
MFAALVLSAVVTLIPAFCYADEPPPVTRAPVKVEVFFMAPGQKIWIPPPVNTWGRGFTFDEYLVLLQMDADLKLLRDQAAQRFTLVEEISLQWKQLLSEKDLVIASLERDKGILSSRGVRLEEKWDQCEKSLVEASGGPIWPYIVAIAGVGVGVVMLSIGIGMTISADMRTAN